MMYAVQEEYPLTLRSYDDLSWRELRDRLKTRGIPVGNGTQKRKDFIQKLRHEDRRTKTEVRRLPWSLTPDDVDDLNDMLESQLQLPTSVADTLWAMLNDPTSVTRSTLVQLFTDVATRSQHCREKVASLTEDKNELTTLNLKCTSLTTRLLKRLGTHALESSGPGTVR